MELSRVPAASKRDVRNDYENALDEQILQKALAPLLNHRMVVWCSSSTSLEKAPRCRLRPCRP